MIYVICVLIVLSIIAFLIAGYNFFEEHTGKSVSIFAIIGLIFIISAVGVKVFAKGKCPECETKYSLYQAYCQNCDYQFYGVCECDVPSVSSLPSVSSCEHCDEENLETENHSIALIFALALFMIFSVSLTVYVQLQKDESIVLASLQTISIIDIITAEVLLIALLFSVNDNRPECKQCSRPITHTVTCTNCGYDINPKCEYSTPIKGD